MQTINPIAFPQTQKKKTLFSLAVVFVIGGVWDVIAGVLYLFFIGTGRKIDAPPMHSFYAVFLGSFFLCFAWLQFFSAVNIRRYAMNVGCLIMGRVFYVVVLYSYLVFVKDFPATFWFTGVIDGALVLLYLVFAFRCGLQLRDLFLPVKEG
jgi:hypothetical protein